MDTFLAFLKRALIVVLIMVVAGFMLWGLAKFSPTVDGAKAAVEDEGYSNVVVTGPMYLEARFYCAEDDYYYFDVQATNPAGDNVNLYVCAGLMKGYTIRHH